MCWQLIHIDSLSRFILNEGGKGTKVKSYVDTGPILLQREIEIGPDDTLGTIYFGNLYQMGVTALVDAVRMVREGTAPRVPQDESLATYEAPCGPEHARVDFTRPAREVHDFVRGLSPRPCAHTADGGTNLRIYRTRLVDPSRAPAPAGTPVASGPSTIMYSIQSVPSGTCCAIHDVVPGLSPPYQ